MHSPSQISAVLPPGEDSKKGLGDGSRPLGRCRGGIPTADSNGTLLVGGFSSYHDQSPRRLSDLGVCPLWAQRAQN